MSTELKKSLGVYRGTAILLSIVIGAGLLTLPGLAVQSVGSQAIVAWVLCALAAVPLLAVFIVLGKRYPDAGGIASYARTAFGPIGSRAATFLFLGAVVFGLPSIALSGGHYLASVIGGSPHYLALALLFGALLPYWMPGNGASTFMAWIASLVLFAIVIVVLIGLYSTSTGRSNAVGIDLSASGLRAALVPFTMLFFAFTGWEVGAGTAEEFKEPKRDFPVAMVLSFVVATALYFIVAFVTMTADLNGRYEAPFVEVVRPVLGDHGSVAVGLVAALIVFANLSGAVWGVSRMIFGLGRSGELPSMLARTTANGQPVHAVAATVLTLATVLLLASLGAFDMGEMIALAGQNFLILYGLSAAVLYALAQTNFDRALAAVVVAIVGGLLAMQGLALAYPLLLVIGGTAFELLRIRRRRAA